MDLQRVAIYARVSTEEQAEHGFSIDAQIETLESYCKATQKVVVQKNVDRGVSGKSMKGRLELQAMLEAAANSEFDEVIVWKINRLARNQVDLLNIVDHLNKNNVGFRSYSEPNIETTTPTGKFLFTMLGAVGELERNTIVDNVKLGMKQRARQGKWNGGTVLGYQTVDDTLQVVPAEAALVTRIFELYASGRGYKAIANLLNHEGHQTKRGKPFGINSIEGILKNPLYMGKIRYNVRVDWNEKRRKGRNPDPIIVDGQHEPIISEELWEQVKKLIQSKGGKQKRVHDNDFFLTGLLRCLQCGAGMVMQRNTSRRKTGNVTLLYYTCGAFKNKGSAVCKANTIRKEVAEDYVIKRLKEVILQPSILEDVVKKINATMSGKIKPLEDELRGIDKSLTSIDAKKQKLFKLYEDDLIDKDDLSKRFDALKDEYAKLEARKEEISPQLQDQNRNPIAYSFVQSVLTQFDKLLRSAPPEQQKALLRLIIKKITIKKDRRKIESIELCFDEEVQTYFLGQAPSANAGGAFRMPRKRADWIGMIRPFTIAI
ncbi:site-specific DNA recombinase [Tumebacillus sp. BK434]|uniref:recombinase family protein n=1 Tax=Tumebacillus sp. BK434 TaxID=2512169 RepID=UPI00104D56ED|nr:recombinase family protein [Tumebacillus sp. BK434]TCP52557.1 site-specific DNA recombinase [Tumebacillus sp. BK434]